MRFLLASAFAVLSFLSAAPARADIWFWQDDKTGMSLTFPDTWAVMNNRAPDDLNDRRPGHDNAMCRIRAREDRRFMIYPVRYMSAVFQKVAYSNAFWEYYVNGDYDLVNLDVMQDDAGLGRGNASYALATFDAPGPDDRGLKRGLMFALALQRHGLYRRLLGGRLCLQQLGRAVPEHRQVGGLQESLSRTADRPLPGFPRRLA